MSSSDWHFHYRVMKELPALAWVADISAAEIEVRCGRSVRLSDKGFFEGAWAGSPALATVADATTVFGSGLVISRGALVAVPPSHTHEGVYAVRRGEEVFLSNSFVALLTRAGLQLDPGIGYPNVFGEVAVLKLLADDGRPDLPTTGLLRHSHVLIPTTTETVSAFFYENALVGADGSLTQILKPREAQFHSFDDYRRRLGNAVAAVFANAPPYEPVVALSAGYDSAAVAAVAAEFGCRRALSLSSGRSFPDGAATPDSGAHVAQALGMEWEVFDRLAYRARTDLPEAEFLASGMSGEDVVFSSFEERLRRTLLLTGFWAGDFWVKSHGYPPPYLPGDFSGCSLAEFRIRTDFVHVPLTWFGAVPRSDPHPFIDQPDMRPYSVGGGYDRPIPRRLVEEAGVERGTFARTKQAATVLLHRDGLGVFAVATVAALERFAAAQGVQLVIKSQVQLKRWQRALIRIAHALRTPSLVRGLQRRRQMGVTFESDSGTLLLRWAVSVVRPRYQALATSPNE